MIVLIIGLTDACVAGWYLTGFLEPKYNKRAVFICCAVANLLSTYAAVFLKTPPVLKVLLITIALFMCALFLTKSALLRKIWMVVLYSALQIIVDASFLLLVSGALGLPYEQFLSIAGDIGAVCTRVIILIILILLFAVFKRHNIHQMPPYMWSLAIMIPLISSIALLAVVGNIAEMSIERVSGALFRYLLIFIVLSANAVNLALLTRLGDGYTYKTRYSLLLQEYERRKSQFEADREHFDVLRRLRHDAKQHYANIERLIETGKYDELSVYIKKAYDEIDGEVKKHTGNHAIDLILSSKASAILANQCTLKVTGDLSETVPIDSFDLAVIVGNAFDNAIEACSKVISQTVAKEICFSAHIINSHLYLAIKNPYEGKRFPKGAFFQSTKETAALHGIGLESIALTVDKLSGHMKCSAEKGVFSVVVLLPLEA